MDLKAYLPDRPSLIKNKCRLENKNLICFYIGQVWIKDLYAYEIALTKKMNIFRECFDRAKMD